MLLALAQEIGIPRKLCFKYTDICLNYCVEFSVLTQKDKLTLKWQWWTFNMATLKFGRLNNEDRLCNLDLFCTINYLRVTDHSVENVEQI